MQARDEVTHKRLSRGATTLAALALACSDPEPAKDGRLELLTWWSQPSELSAMEAVIDVHRAQHPGVVIDLLTSDDQTSMAKDVTARLAEGSPPNAFQVNLGGNALQWSSNARPLTDRAERWSEHFRESILERLTAGGELIGVPVALTRQNNVYYNLEVLSELGLSIPIGREELSSWLEQLAQLGYTHPLCIGDQYNWVSAHVLFEDIVPGYVGAEHSQRFWSGQLSAEDPLFAEALAYAATLNPYWNEDFAELDWAAGIERLMQRRSPEQQCVMTPMGDWGGAILASTHGYDEAFTQRAWPGAEGLFVLAGDAFVITRGTRHLGAALDFFDTLASEAGQVAFNAKKGSVPARTLPEARRTEFGPLTRANMTDLAEGTALPAFKVAGSSAFPFDELALLTHDFLLVGDALPLITFIGQHYDKLAEAPRN